MILMNNQFERGTVSRLTEKERKAAFRHLDVGHL